VVAVGAVVAVGGSVGSFVAVAESVGADVGARVCATVGASAAWVGAGSGVGSAVGGEPPHAASARTAKSKTSILVRFDMITSLQRMR
jgi:hypothetical protein